MAMLT